MQSQKKHGIQLSKQKTGEKRYRQCYSMKLDLLTNATVVDDAIRFVSQKLKEKIKSSVGNSNENDKENQKNLITTKVKIS
jgi:hypothetical protein